MDIEQIRILLEKDIDGVLDILDEVFADLNGTYNDLCKEYINRPENFSLSIFRGKLKRFINISKTDIQDYFAGTEEDTNANSKTIDPEKTYTLLCHLDFRAQVDYFESMVESKKPVIPFVLRAAENYGQRWLYNRLIHHYQEKRVIHKTFLIDFKELKIDSLDNLIDYLSEQIGVQKYNPNDSFDKKKIKLRNTISALIDTASQFIVLKNAYSFIHSSDFDKFYELLNHFYEELDAIEPEHKCIFLFVEQVLEPYTDIEKYCVFSSETKSFKAKMDKTLKIVDLDAIKGITRKCMEEWFGKVPEEIIEYFDSSDEGLEQLIKECGNGNPEMIIPAICEKIGINFHEHKSTWLKY